MRWPRLIAGMWCIALAMGLGTDALAGAGAPVRAMTATDVAARHDAMRHPLDVLVAGRDGAGDGGRRAVPVARTPGGVDDDARGGDGVVGDAAAGGTTPGAVDDEPATPTWDACPEIPGVQDDDYDYDGQGRCTGLFDWCPAVDGRQSEADHGAIDQATCLGEEPVDDDGNDGDDDRSDDGAGDDAAGGDDATDGDPLPGGDDGDAPESAPQGAAGTS